LPPSESTLPARTGRLFQLALFFISAIWFRLSRMLAVHAGRGIAYRLGLFTLRPLLNTLFFLFLLVLGFSILNAVSNSQPTSLRNILGLPKRPTARREWMLGTAIGWGAGVLAVLPIALFGSLQFRFWTAPRAFELLLLNLAIIVLATLANEILFRGFPFQRLIEAVGPVAATIIVSVWYGLLRTTNPYATRASVLVTMIAGLLLAIAWLRTHGLWLGWGLHAAWSCTMALLFGLPLSGDPELATVIQGHTFGPLALTGGDYGPEGAMFTIIALLIAIAVVVAVTRDYAWDYTHSPIVAAGYAVEAQPPAAHAAMEQRPAAPAPAAVSLVQILPATPQARSASDEPKP
jgi:uncharacterized protein